MVPSQPHCCWSCSCPAGHSSLPAWDCASPQAETQTSSYCFNSPQTLSHGSRKGADKPNSKAGLCPSQPAPCRTPELWMQMDSIPKQSLREGSTSFSLFQGCWEYSPFLGETLIRGKMSMVCAFNDAEVELHC